MVVLGGGNVELELLRNMCNRKDMFDDLTDLRRRDLRRPFTLQGRKCTN